MTVFIATLKVMVEAATAEAADAVRILLNVNRYSCGT